MSSPKRVSAMKLLSLLILATGVVVECQLPQACRPTVPDCPVPDSSECPTCCCSSSSNVKFYNPDSPGPECTAMPALYLMNFTSTWTNTCQPDTFSSESQWNSPISVSHNSSFRLWDACMDNVPPELATFSTSGDGTQLRNVYLLQRILAGFLLDYIQDDPIPDEGGFTTSEVVLDRYHPLISVLGRVIPSPDYVAGVADLELCDGDKWKDNVMICLELFSTGAASDRVAPEMERNSVQGDNCSYGFIELILLETQDFEPRDSIPQTCYPKVPKKCFSENPINECPTCCCESSENVEFYDPDSAMEPSCDASSPAVYEIKFTYMWDSTCHPDYNFPLQAFTNPIAVSHTPQYRMWDACMDNPSLGIRSIAENGVVSVILQQFLAAGENYLNSSVADLFIGEKGSVSLNLTVDSGHQWVSAGLMLVPSPDRFLGVADLRLCDGEQWKEKVKVCFELFSTATASERVAPSGQRNSVQANNCSFGYMEFTLISPALSTTANIGVILTFSFLLPLLLIN